MAQSLKSTFPALGPVLGETPDALYSRQRAFVRAGLLPTTPGRGPGSGVAGTPESVALFLIGMLTNAGLAENAPLARSIAKACPGPEKCAFTGASTFKEAVAAVLADEDLAYRVNDIQVAVNGGYAQIRYDGLPAETWGQGKFTRPPTLSVFVSKEHKRGGVVFEARLPPDTIRKLAKAMRDAGQ